MSQNPENDLDVPFKTLLDDNVEEVPEHDHSRFARLGAFFGSTVVIALCLGLIMSPLAVLSSAGFNQGVDYWATLPSDLEQYDTPLAQKTVLLDKNGDQFATLYTENRELLKVDDANEFFVDALIATEDSRFWETKGLDYVGLTRSVLSTIGGSRQGGSGITQQLVKSLQIMNSETKEQAAAAMNRNVATKIQELKYAVEIEKNNPKEEILEKYLNTVYFGNGAYGLSAAARTYFDTTQDKLTREQAATLVGVINNPTMFDPFTVPEDSQARRDTVLWRALDEGMLTEEEYEKSTAVPLETKAGSFSNGCDDSDYPYYCELVRQEMVSNPAFGETQDERDRIFAKGGLTVTTAMDPKAMDVAAEEAKRAYAVDNRVATGIAMVEPGTGKIRAVGQNREWGSADATQTEIIFAQANRQTGSAFKPITLATAFEQGIPADTRLVSNGPYTPANGDAPPGGFTNYGNFNYGSVDSYEATKMSMNIYFVKMMEKTGVTAVADMAGRLGMYSLPREGDRAIGDREYSLTLGSYESSPLQMANVYATFASGGVKCNTVSIVEAKRTDSREKIKVSDPDCHQAIMPHVANTLSDVLQAPFKAPGSMSALSLNGGRQAAAKTGTTNDWADAWTVGYTPQYATAVWTGDPRGGAQYPLTDFVQYGIQLSGGIAGDGSKAAGPVWKSVMDRVHEGQPKKSFPKVDKGVSTAVSNRAVPDVRGADVNVAITTLQEEGFVVKIAPETTGDPSIHQKNAVMSQTPTGGTTGIHGDEVILTLSPDSDVDMIISEDQE